MASKIMIVDDEPETRELIEFKFRKIIKSRDFDFYFCANGQEAFKQYQNGLHDVEVIVSDINMPVMNGFGLIENISKSESDVKFIMMSAYGDLPNIRKAMNMGAYDFVTKPINFNDLEVTIKRAVSEVKAKRRIMELERKANENLLFALEKEKRLNILRKSFLSMISREYRAPLTVIQTSAELIKLSQSKDYKNTSQKFIDDIEKQIKLMTSLLDDILTYSSLEDYIESFNPMKVNLDGMMNSILSDYNKDNRKNLDYEFTNLTGSDVILCDENLFNQIMRNLISNAEKYSNSGSKVRLLLRDSEGVMECTVSDDGIGIPSNDKSLIFEPFYRASNTRGLQGTGLGLTIVKKCLQALNGTIEVDSEIGRGTTFTVKIDCRKFIKR